MEKSYNLRSPAVKRLMREAQELKEPTKDYSAQPLDDNLFEWHFTFRGPETSDFEGGFYHGRIILPPEYPMKPPSIMLLNPNGRFELNKKICLSISGYHPESWQPSWSIRTAILAIIAFMPSKGEGAIGALDYTSDERKVLAKKSRTYSCSSCGPISSLLSSNSTDDKQMSKSEEKDRELAKKIVFNKPKDTSKSSESSPKDSDSVSDPNAESSSNITELNANTVRHRQPPAFATATPQQTSPSSPSTLSATQSESEKTSLVIIVVLVIAIAVLLLRRIDRSYNITSTYLQ